MPSLCHSAARPLVPDDCCLKSMHPCSEHVLSRALGANARAALAVCRGEKRMWDQLLAQIQERRQRQTAAV